MTLLISVLVASAPWTSLSLSPPLRALLDRGAFTSTPGGFKAITLSHVADGCAAQARQHPEKAEAARVCVEAAFQRLTEQFPASCAEGRCDAERLLTTENPLALSHLLLVLGAIDSFGPCVDETLHQALARDLAERSVSDPFGTVPSYREATLRWPADQTALLAGLHRADVAHGWTFHEAPVKRFLEVIDERGLHRSGLPVSELTGAGPGARYPRGCAQSFISRYFAEVEPTRTAAWWKTYRAHFLERLPLSIAGFREWPRGVERASDIDSGPIVLGIGVAASALGISAAKAQGDTALAHQLEVSAARVKSLGVGSAVASATFASAIEFEARWHPSPL